MTTRTTRRLRKRFALLAQLVKSLARRASELALKNLGFVVPSGRAEDDSKNEKARRKHEV
jgi:hypothetical protein